MASLMAVASFRAGLAKTGEQANENGEYPEGQQSTAHADEQHGQTECHVVHGLLMLGVFVLGFSVSHPPNPLAQEARGGRSLSVNCHPRSVKR